MTVSRARCPVALERDAGLRHASHSSTNTRATGPVREPGGRRAVRSAHRADAPISSYGPSYSASTEWLLQGDDAKTITFSANAITLTNSDGAIYRTM